MYSVSNDFLTEISRKAREFYWTGTITTKDGTVYSFTNEDILKGSGYITRSCCGNSEIELGSVYAAELGISLFSDVDRYSLDDAEIKLYFHLRLQDNSIETIPMGIFEIKEANRAIKTLEIKAYDYMLRFDKPFVIDSTSGNAYNFLSFICDACDVEMAQTQAEIRELPNANEMLSIYTENDIETYRDLLFYVAQVLGCVAQINREGKLVLIPYNSTPVFEITAQQRFNSTYSDFVTRYTAVSSTNLRTETAEYYALETDDGLTFNLGSNPLLQFGLPATRERLIRRILDAIAVINYVPCDATTIGNPALDPLDCITFSGGHADSNAMSCITNITYRINGKHTIKCVGKNPTLSQAKSKSDKNISGLINQFDENKTVVYDFTNIVPISIGSSQTEIIAIDYTAKENTSAMFLAEILLDITANDEVKTISGNATYIDDLEEETTKEVSFTFSEKYHPKLTVYYYMNNNLVEEFQPKQVCHEGEQILTLFFPLSAIVANSINTFSVCLKIENGSGTIDENQIKAIINGQGLVSGLANWNGRLNFDEFIDPIQVNFENIAYATISEVLTAETDVPDPLSITQGIGTITVGNFANITLLAPNERLAVEPVVVSTTITTEFSVVYDFNSEFVDTSDNVFKLRTDFEEEGTPAQVDSGLLTSITLNFGDYASFDDIEIKER